MTTVILCEKPSVAADLARLLGTKQKHSGYYTLLNGDIVTHARGHLFELANPKSYNEAWGGTWRWDLLPMLPEVFKLQTAYKKEDMVKLLKTLIKNASKVVIATDAGREGELIARDILAQCKYKGPVERFWTSDSTDEGMLKAYRSLRSGKSTEALYEAAAARRKADWMLGLSGTRAVTLAANVSRTAFPIGRVQTPVLGMVVQRCEDVKNFKSSAYYELEAEVHTSKGEEFKMWHKPAKGEDRITDESVAKALLAQAAGADGVLKVTTTPSKESPPLLYSLPVLQQDANRVLGLSAKNTLEVAQQLYEKKAISYPRTDSQHLGQSHKAEVSETVRMIERNFKEGVAVLDSQGIMLRDSTFDDSKLSDHHGIIPSRQFVQLTGIELQVFTFICQRYLQAMAQDHRYDQTLVSLDANGVPFKASGRVITRMGWKEIKLI